MKKLLFAIVLASAFISACHKSEEKFYDPDPLKVNLKYKTLGHWISWNSLSDKDLVEYRIWESKTVDTFSVSTTVKAKIIFSSKLDTIFKELKEPFAGVNYRVEAVYKDRSIWSKNYYLVDDRLQLSNGVFKTAFQDSVTNKIYFIINNQLLVFDNSTEKLLPQTLDLEKNWNLFSVAFGNYEGKREIYVGSKTHIDVYDAQNLDKIKTIDLLQTVYNLTADANQHLVYNTLDSLVVWDRKTGTNLSSAATDFRLTSINYLPKRQKFIATDVTNNIMYYVPDNQATMNLMVQQQKNIKSLGQNGKLSSKVSFYPDELHFLILPNFSYLDKNFVQLGKIYNYNYFNEIDLDKYPIIYGTNGSSLTQINIFNGGEKSYSSQTHNINKLIILNSKKWLITSQNKPPFNCYIEGFE